MFATDLDMQILAALTAAACALPGAYLVLRRMAFISDAISHVMLPGIVLTFLLVPDLESPLLRFGAALSGVATVALVELLQRTRLVREDAAIGLVYPALLAIGLVLVSLKTGDIHLDIDSVLVGDLGLAASRKIPIGGRYLVSVAALEMGAILGLNVLFAAAFYKELKLTTFDPALAAALGFAPVLLNYALMTLVSLTAVTAFDAVGSALVVPLMVVPPATAYLLTERLSRMLVLSVVLGAIGAIGGFWLARSADANFAGAIASVLGMEFGLAWLFAPRRGLLAQWSRRRRQWREFLQTLLAVHLLNHEGTPAEAEESGLTRLHLHLRWTPALTARVVGWASHEELVQTSHAALKLTESGRRLARQMIGPAPETK